MVYPERGWWAVESLNARSTFHIVDPGNTKDSCNLSLGFQPNFMIVASTEEDHWGGRGFSKQRDSVAGVMRYYPMWDLEELPSARQYFPFGKQLSDEDVETRFRQFGGVPGHVFSPEGSLVQVLQKAG